MSITSQSTTLKRWANKDGKGADLQRARFSKTSIYGAKFSQSAIDEATFVAVPFDRKTRWPQDPPKGSHLNASADY
jgi:hypothetical protein